MATLDTLLGRVHDEFPSVPQDVALRALSDSAKEFCSKAHVWREALSQIRVVPGVLSYDLDIDPGVQIAAVKDVRLNGAKIDPLATEIPSLRRRTPMAGEPRAYIQGSPSSIELDRAPLEGAALDVTAALTLALGSTTVDLPDSVVDEYGEVIADGAKMRLVRQANQPWYAPDSVLSYAGPYYSAITSAKRRSNSALGEAEVQVQMRRW